MDSPGRLATLGTQNVEKQQNICWTPQYNFTIMSNDSLLYYLTFRLWLRSWTLFNRHIPVEPVMTHLSR